MNYSNNLELSTLLEISFKAFCPTILLCRDDFDLAPTKSIEEGLHHLRNRNVISEAELHEELKHYFFGNGSLRDVINDPDCQKELDRLLGNLKRWHQRLQQSTKEE